MNSPQFANAIRVERGNPELQDCAAIVDLEAGLLVVLADGAGGRSNAREAAEAVVQTIKNETKLVSRLDGIDCVRTLLRADQAALNAGGESTGVFAIIARDGIIGASVGDSEAWIISERELVVLTKAQKRKPCLGTGMTSPIAFSAPALAGTLLVASDGLFKYTSRDAIVPIVRQADLNAAAQELVRLVRYPSGELPDDVSVILVR